MKTFLITYRDNQDEIRICKVQARDIGDAVQFNPLRKTDEILDICEESLF